MTKKDDYSVLSTEIKWGILDYVADNLQLHGESSTSLMTSILSPFVVLTFSHFLLLPSTFSPFIVISRQKKVV